MRIASNTEISRGIADLRRAGGFLGGYGSSRSRSEEEAVARSHCDDE
jgi:hypothetical protein